MRLPAKRAQVLTILGAHPHGLTAADIARLDDHPGFIAPSGGADAYWHRLRRLQRDGLAARAGTRPATRPGTHGTIWTITSQGRRALSGDPSQPQLPFDA